MTFLSAQRCPVCETRHVEQMLWNCEYDGEEWFACEMCEHVFAVPVDAAPPQNSDDYLDAFRFRPGDEHAILRPL